MSTKALAILNTVLCILALAASLMVAMGAIFGLAGIGSGDAFGNKFIMSSAGVLATLGLASPCVAFAALVVGWIAYKKESRKLIIICCVFPWIYMIVVTGLFFLLPSLMPSAQAAPTPTEKSSTAEPNKAAQSKLNTRMPVTPAQSITILPPAVRAPLPEDAISMHWGQLPIWQDGAPLMCHIWREPDRSGEYRRHHTEFPYHVELSQQNSRGAWQLFSSASYNSSNWPDKIETRRLEPKKQRGIVLVLYCSTMYSSNDVQVVTFAANASPSRRGTAQKFEDGGYGDNRISQSFGVDSRGLITVVSKTQEEGKPLVTQVFAWNGQRYITRAKNAKE